MLKKCDWTSSKPLPGRLELPQVRFAHQRLRIVGRFHRPYQNLPTAHDCKSSVTGWVDFDHGDHRVTQRKISKTLCASVSSVVNKALHSAGFIQQIIVE